MFDFVALKVNKQNEGFAVATLITGIIWFLIGEIDFKESRYSMKEYIFIFGIILAYLSTGLLMNNVIIAFVIYILIVIGLNIAFMRKDVLLLINELKVIVVNVKRKFIVNK